MRKTPCNCKLRVSSGRAEREVGFLDSHVNIRVRLAAVSSEGAEIAKHESHPAAVVIPSYSTVLE